VEKRLLDKFSSGLRQVHIHYHPYTEKISLSNNHPENKESQGVNI
jgi:hypothetical protein